MEPNVMDRAGARSQVPAARGGTESGDWSLRRSLGNAPPHRHHMLPGEVFLKISVPSLVPLFLHPILLASWPFPPLFPISEPFFLF